MRIIIIALLALFIAGLISPYKVSLVLQILIVEIYNLNVLLYNWFMQAILAIRGL